MHAGLKRHWSSPGDLHEVELDGFVIDIVRDNELIEIQTGSFGAMGSKLDKLLPLYRITVVHPIATTVTLARRGKADRRSPKHGALHDLFDELVSLPTMLDHPNFRLEVALVRERRVKEFDPSLRRRRGGWRTVDRQMEAVEEIYCFEDASDLDQFLPAELPEEFTTAEMAKFGPYGRPMAQKVAYCLRALDRIEVVGRDQSGYHYRRPS